MSLGLLESRGRDPGCHIWGKAPITWQSQVRPALQGRASGHGVQARRALCVGVPELPSGPERNLSLQSCLRHRAPLGLSLRLSLSVRSCLLSGGFSLPSPQHLGPILSMVTWCDSARLICLA